MKTMLRLSIYVSTNMKTQGGESHKNVRYVTVWQDIVFSIFITFNNKCTYIFSPHLPFSYVLYLS